MMKDYTLERLFPTTVYRNKVGYELTDELIDKIKNTNYQLVNTGSWSDSDYRVLDNPVFAGLKAELQKHVDFYAKEIFKYDTVEVYITSSWLNFNPPMSYHNKHHHSNSLFSGVYYIAVPENVPNLSFYSKLNHMFFITPSEWNEHNSPYWTLEVKEDDLLLFPSCVEHEVTRNYTKMNRVCLAFNTFVRGSIGDRNATESCYQEIL